MARGNVFSVVIDDSDNKHSIKKGKVDMCETANHQTSFLFWLHKTVKDWGRNFQTVSNEEIKVMKDTEAFSTSGQI